MMTELAMKLAKLSLSIEKVRLKVHLRLMVGVSSVQRHSPFTVILYSPFILERLQSLFIKLSTSSPKLSNMSSAWSAVILASTISNCIEIHVNSSRAHKTVSTTKSDLAEMSMSLNIRSDWVVENLVCCFD